MKKIFSLIISLVLVNITTNAQLPDFTLTDCNGVTHNLYDDLRAGNSVVLNVCAGWCQPCRVADPKLENFYQQTCGGTGNIKVYGLLYETNIIGQISDCTFGTQYATQYNLTFPLLTNCSSTVAALNIYNPSNAIPLFVMIIPNPADPANSTVTTFVGDKLDLETKIAEGLNLFSEVGNTCTGPVTLTSGFATGNVWSTGETTQSINVTASGTYNLTTTNGGCPLTLSRSFDLNAVSLAGTAGISATSVCLGGMYTIDFNLPNGDGGEVSWQWSTNGQDWSFFSNASSGPISLTAEGAPGDQLFFRVQLYNRFDFTCDALLSNVVHISFVDGQVSSASGIASIANENVCSGSNFTLSYSGLETGAIWQFRNGPSGSWLNIAEADQGPVTFSTDPGDPTPGYVLRVYVPVANCYALSNEVTVNIRQPWPNIIVPENICAGSGNASLSVNDLRSDPYASVVWAPGGETTSTITVNPDVNNQFSVTATDIYGCTGSTSTTLMVIPPTLPVVTPSFAVAVCPGTDVTLSFTGTNSVPACTDGVQWPENEVFNFSFCNSQIEQIVADGYAGEYSSVHVEAGKLYIFFSLNGDGSMNYIGDHITISDSIGSNVYSTGLNYAYYVPLTTATIRFYNYRPGCGAEEIERQRWAYCSSNIDAWGFSWLPGGQTTHAITVNPATTTNYSVTFSNADFFGRPNCGSGTSASTVTVQSTINPPTPIVDGLKNVCAYEGAGTELSYTVSNISPNTVSYTWIAPPAVTIISGQGTATLVVRINNGFSLNPNKQLRVTASSSCGNSAQAIFYFAAQLPGTPSPITGNTDVCLILGTTDSYTYSIPQVLAASGYIWSATDPNVTISSVNGSGVNDTSVTIRFASGFQTSLISVRATNGCGTSGARSLSIIRKSASTPGLISGPTNVCAFIQPGGTAATYSVVPITNATSYTWTVPAGVTMTVGPNDFTINALYPSTFVNGSVKVTATNGCGTSLPRSTNIHKLNPGAPGVIDVIQTGFCGNEAGRTYTYTLASLPANATSILWTIIDAQGAQIISGQGSNSITVNYPNTSVAGTITAQAVNNCGTSSIRSTTVKLPACPPLSFTRGSLNSVSAQPKLSVAKLPVQQMEVKIFPNPTVTDFNMQVMTPGKDQIRVRIFDAVGRTYKVFTATAYQTISFGADLKAGPYLLEVSQGMEVKKFKIIKF